MPLQPNDLPEKIRNVRTQLGLSQEELAQALGVSFTTVNRWENGKSKPSKLALEKFKSFCEQAKKQGRLA